MAGFVPEGRQRHDLFQVDVCRQIHLQRTGPDRVLSAEAAACKSIRIEENGVCTLKSDKKIRLLSIPKLPLSRSTANPLRSLKEREAIRPRISLPRL